ncbi:MAG: ornithine cyclodeaminase [Candidatus Thermoplasmatota archaeon]|nr:ornithine cyclodeaminase [Candidatus Thermoplasmatota archaeon]MCL5731058.1 ornithine cyclodeaminase [Candidatus Thermoplasmatota archaeon]
MFFITENDVRENLHYGELIEWLRKAFSMLDMGKAESSPRLRTRTGKEILNSLPAIIPELDISGEKVYYSGPAGAVFHYVLFRNSCPSVLAVFEASALGQIRTGALSALASLLMHGRNAKHIHIIGSGYQAESQLMAHLSIYDPEKITVYSRDTRHAESYARRMEKLTGYSISVSNSLEQSLKEADLICSATSARTPFISGVMLPENFHINLVGANLPQRMEADTSVLERAEAVCAEDIKQAMLESSEITGFLSKHPEARIYELKELASGRSKTVNARRTVFKSMGNGIEDLIAAYLVCKNMGIIT